MSDNLKIGPKAAPPPSLVIAGVLSNDLNLAYKAVEQFGAEYGGVDLLGDPIPFDQTNYYEPEMGSNLVRFYCGFLKLTPTEQLPKIKLDAWKVEQSFFKNGCRSVNLDPGVLDHTKVILASFKEAPQKIHMGNAVWADPVLFFSNGVYEPLPWTFPDLRGAQHIQFFMDAKNHYKALLRKWRRGDS